MCFPYYVIKRHAHCSAVEISSLHNVSKSVFVLGSLWLSLSFTAGMVDEDVVDTSTAGFTSCTNSVSSFSISKPADCEFLKIIHCYARSICIGILSFADIILISWFSVSLQICI